MKRKFIVRVVLFLVGAALLLTSLEAQTANREANAGAVRMIVTANADSGKRMSEIQKRDVRIKQGKELLKASRWIPARGDQAGLELFFLIDDASATSLGAQLEDLRAFFRAQPESTVIGVGYARSGNVEVRQGFTTDRNRAAEALRLPNASAGAYGSPYLSAVNLMKRWNASENRHEMVIVTDGIDRPRAVRTRMRIQT